MQTDPTPNPYQAPRADTNYAPAPGDGHPAMTDEEIATFVDDNAAYYAKAWAEPLRTGGFYAGFNLAALIVSTLWLLYRRMYLAFVVVLGIQMLGGLVAGVVTRLAGGQVMWGVLTVMLTTKVALAFVANGLYLRRARRAVDQARAGSAGNINLPFLKTLGGTSSLAVFIGIVINVLLSALSR